MSSKKGPVLRVSGRKLKEDKKLQSLHANEHKQLESFVRSRMKEVDEELSKYATKKRLVNSSDDLTISGDAMRLRGEGTGIGNVMFIDTIENKKNGNNYILSKKQSLNDPNTTKIIKNDETSSLSNKNRLIALLALIKIKMEDAYLNPSELIELLLPSDVVDDDEENIPIGELTEVLHTDLVLPITKMDQRLLLQCYGNEKGEINIKSLLDDAGLWETRSRGMINNDNYSEKSGSSSPNKYSNSDSFSSPTKEFGTLLSTSNALDLASSNIDELAQLHDLIFDELDERKTLHNNNNYSKEIKQTHQNLPTIAEEMESIEPLQRNKDFNFADELYNKNNSTSRADDALMKELDAIDGEFFEELEDLKFRYSRLQELAGDDPNNVKNNSKVSGPLDKLPWSVRDSMTAMDRAAALSPLTQRPLRTTARSDFFDNKLENINKTNSSSQSMPTKSFLRDPDNYSDELRLYSFIPSSEKLNGLCERRLAFEISSHPKPENATRALINRAMEISGRSTHPDFIKIPQLVDVIQSVGLKMSAAEIEILASGFASDGKGGVDVKEFCQTVNSVIYNVMNENAESAAKARLLQKKVSEKEYENNRVNNLMKEICFGILKNDRRSSLGTSENIYKWLLTPFVRLDEDKNGLLSFREFLNALNGIGGVLSVEEMIEISKSLKLNVSESTNSLVVYDDISKNNLLQSFRERELFGSLRGANAVDNNFKIWSRNTFTPTMQIDQNNIIIDYKNFVSVLADIMNEVIENNEGVPLDNSSVPWVLKEYDIVEGLLNQLESVKPKERRRMIMSLNYALTSADSKQEQELDGFTVLNALLTSGFKLQRINRVQLLRSIEELGGKMKYYDLCEILMNSFGDWTSQEKTLVMKILKSMGVTVNERRNWLAHFKKNLMQFSSKSQKNPKNKKQVLKMDVSVDFIPPSAFLHCLRECGVDLNIEEVATLLDCLDFENQTKLGNMKNKLKNENNQSNTVIMDATAGFNPLINYESFLQFCGRHCGSWYDAIPDVIDSLKLSLSAINNINPILVIHELLSLFHSFNEDNNSFITSQEFSICCHRSRLLSNFSEQNIQKMADCLVIDGNGKVNYTSFIIFLRTILNNSTKNNITKKIHNISLIDQLTNNCMDSNGSIIPLRNWIIRNTDVDSNLLKMDEMDDLLQEFSVVYEAEELQSFLINIKQIQNNYNNSLTHNLSNQRKEYVWDTRSFIHQVLVHREHWAIRHPFLCEKINNNLIKVGSQLTYHNNDNYISNQSSSGLLLHNKNNVESIAAFHIISKLKAFSQKNSHNYDNNEIQNGDNRQVFMIEKEIFSFILKQHGVSLDEEELLALADATDPDPFASSIRCDILLDCLLVDTNISKRVNNGQINHLNNNNDSSSHSIRKKNHLTEAGMRALESIRKSIWSTGKALNRNEIQWSADVRVVFNGFDLYHNQLLSVDDIMIALRLLNVNISIDVLRDISQLPSLHQKNHYFQKENNDNNLNGFMDCKEFLDFILVPPSSTLTLQHDPQLQHQLQHKNMKNNHLREHNNSNNDDEEDKLLPVKMLINMIRKSFLQFDLSLHPNQIWTKLIQSFRVFDLEGKKEFVSPRDFCLAISSLLKENDIILTKDEWMIIFDYYKINNNNDRKKEYNNFEKNDDFEKMRINYIIFCEDAMNKINDINIAPPMNAKKLTDKKNVNSNNDKNKRLLRESKISSSSDWNASATKNKTRILKKNQPLNKQFSQTYH
eukprot:gene4635-6514_t